MYSFSQRKDATCVDEPLYAHHLTRCPWVYRPYRAELLKAQSTDGSKVLEELTTVRQLQSASDAQPAATALTASSVRSEQPQTLSEVQPAATAFIDFKGVVYAKHMAKHSIALDPASYTGPLFINLLLVRDPRRVAASFLKKVQGWTSTELFDELGFGDLEALYDAITERTGFPIIVSADRLAADPEPTLRALCAALGLPWDPAMLTWPTGPKDCDGLWASHWYHDGVHTSSGFTPTPLSPPPLDFPEEAQHHIRRAIPIYQKLSSRALGDPVHNESINDSESS